MAMQPTSASANRCHQFGRLPLLMLLQGGPELPPNVQLLTLQALGRKQLLLRLAHPYHARSPLQAAADLLCHVCLLRQAQMQNWMQNCLVGGRLVRFQMLVPVLYLHGWSI